MIVQDAFWSALAALGFALVFNAPRRALVPCIICGAAGHTAREVIQSSGFGIEVATLIGATLVGLLSSWFARRLAMPAMIFAICGAIPLVPGSFAFRAMLGLIRVATGDPATVMDALVEASVNLVKTGLILAMLAGGIAAPSLLFERRRPIV